MIRVKRKETAWRKKKPEIRIFPWLVDSATFLDKIVLSIDGKLKQHFDLELLDTQSTGILRPGTVYSRRVSAIFGLSGNPILIRYGKAKKFNNVPSVQLIMQSAAVPVTCAQAMMLVKTLTDNSPKITVSALELTFDFTSVTVDYVRKHLVHRARGDVRVLSSRERKTIYVGSPRSAWQARIYQKRAAVIRLEFILRRPFLSKYGINQPEDVLSLRKLNIWNLLSIRRFSERSAIRVTMGWKNQLARRIVLGWRHRALPLDALVPILRGNGVHPQRVLRLTRLQRLLFVMQSRVVW